MPSSIGVNLRVTGHCHQGGRKYMEDVFSVAYQQTDDEKDLQYAFFGIFDGHGGREAAVFAKENLMDQIVSQRNFWSDCDDLVLKAIRDGFINTHYAMWKELEKWPKTPSGLPSTSGTTASIVFIRRGKIYIGHVGDSAIVLGYEQPGLEGCWRAKPLTRDHKPESADESERILQSGGKVICKSGVPRVVWNRPRLGHKGPVRRSTHIDEIPFLAVARSLGDLWSYNSSRNQFVVSPEPDVCVIPVDVCYHRCLILGTDGLWNMLSPDTAVQTVLSAERHNEKRVVVFEDGAKVQSQVWLNPSKRLVDRALERWNSHRTRADNTSVVTVMLDPPGPPRAQVLMREKCRMSRPSPFPFQHRYQPATPDLVSSDLLGQTSPGVAVVTRHPSDSSESASSDDEEHLSAPPELVQINKVTGTDPPQQIVRCLGVPKRRTRAKPNVEEEPGTSSDTENDRQVSSIDVVPATDTRLLRSSKEALRSRNSNVALPLSRRKRRTFFQPHRIPSRHGSKIKKWAEPMVTRSRGRTLRK